MANKSLSINAISNLVALAVNSLISIILTPRLIAILGDELYGTWMLIISFVAVYGILDLGLSSAIGRYIAYNLGNNNKRGVQEVFSTALIIFLVLGIFLVIFTLFFAPSITTFFSISEPLQGDFILALVIISISVALSLINNTFVATLIAYEKFPHFNSVRILSEILRFTLILILARGENPILKLAIATLSSIAFQGLLLWILNKFFIKTQLYSLKAVNFKTVKTLIIFSLPAALTIFAEMLRTHMDTLVIAKLLLLSSVTVYTIGSRFITFLTRFMVSLSGILDPRFAFFAGQSNKKEINKLFSEAVEFLTYTALALGFLLIWMGPGILHAWVGNEYQNAYSVLVILSIAQSFAAAQMPIISLLFAMNKHQILAVVVLIEGIANLLLSILLAPYFGIEGVAIGTLIPIILRILFLPVYLKKVLGIPFQVIYLPIIKGATAYTLVFFLLRKWQPQNLNWSDVFLWGIITSLLIFLFTAIFLFSKRWKNILILHISKLFSNVNIKK